MSVPALMFERETPVQERVAQLEANVQHIQTDVSEMKVDVRRLSDKVTNLELAFEKSFAALKISRMLDRVWWLLICAALLTVMARGFKWI